VENQVEEIKRKLDIVETISKYINLKKRGRHFLACCPFHQEKTPSFTVSSELQIFKCFGCGKSGDVITFVQEFNRVTFPEALEDLAKMAGVTLVRSVDSEREKNRSHILLSINAEVARFYHYILTTHPLGEAARNYLESRNITKETITRFKLGLSPDNPGLIITHLQKKGFKPADLIATGTFGQSSYNNRLYDRFRGRLIFPQIDYRDRILAFSGRVLPGAPDNQAKYINSPETELYHKSHMVYALNEAKTTIKESGVAVVVEGEFDAISPHQAGFTNFIALKGTAFTTDQLALLHRYAQTLILALDADFAGNNAALKSINEADNLGFDLRVLNLGGTYKDPDEAISKDPEFFRAQLEAAIPVWDFVINTALLSFDTSSPQGKKQALALVLPFLSKISNAVIRSDYLKKFADLIGSSEEALTQEAAKHLSPSTVILPQSPPNAPDSSPLEVKLEEACLVLLFSAKKPYSLAAKLKTHLAKFTSPRHTPIITVLLSQTDTTRFDAISFRDLLPPEFHQIFENIYLSAVALNLTSGQRQVKLKLTFARWETNLLKKRLSEIATLYRRQDSGLDPKAHVKLEAESQAIIGRLSVLQSRI